MKVIFSIDTEKEDDEIFHKLFTEKNNIIVGAYELRGLYRKIYNLEFGDDIIKCIDIECEDINGKKYTKNKKFIDLDIMEYELEQLYAKFKKLTE